MESSGESHFRESDSNTDVVRRALLFQRSSIIKLVAPGQSVIESIVSLSEEDQNGGRVIILAATGSVLNPTIMSRRRRKYTYEGSYVIKKLRGSFNCTGDGGFTHARWMAVLRDADGNEIQGLPVGPLIADTPVQVYISYFTAHPVTVVRPVSMYSNQFGPSNI